MTLNRVKLGRAVTFTKYLANVMYLIFPLKTLTLTGKWAYEEYLQINLPIFFFLSSLSLLNLKISELIAKELP